MRSDVYFNGLIFFVNVMTESTVSDFLLCITLDSIFFLSIYQNMKCFGRKEIVANKRTTFELMSKYLFFFKYIYMVFDKKIVGFLFLITKLKL